VHRRVWQGAQAWTPNGGRAQLRPTGAKCAF